MAVRHLSAGFSNTCQKNVDTNMHTVYTWLPGGFRYSQRAISCTESWIAGGFPSNIQDINDIYIDAAFYIIEAHIWKGNSKKTPVGR